jgi:hypothetical protein
VLKGMLEPKTKEIHILVVVPKQAIPLSLQVVGGKRIPGKGVSILFASPGLPGMNGYAKASGYSYVMPAWSLEELLDCNELLDDKIKLADEVLISRYYKYGGIPRYIFTDTDLENNSKLNEAIGSFDVFDILSYAKSGLLARDVRYSHHILEMVPSNSDFRAAYYLDFLSKDIAERAVNRVKADSLKRLSEFAIPQSNDDSGSSCTLQGRIYEILCHRQFKLRKQEHNLKLCLLGSKEHVELTIPADMPAIVHFSTLADIPVLSPGLTYYQSKSKIFDAVDAFILDGDNKRCYGLQMTLNRDHGIKALSLKNFVFWLKSKGIAKEHLYFCFVIPSALAPSFQKQKILTNSKKIHQRAGNLASMAQYVILQDVFIESMLSDQKKKQLK